MIAGDFRRILAVEAARLSAPAMTPLSPPAATTPEPSPDDRLVMLLDGILLSLMNLQSSAPQASVSVAGSSNPNSRLQPSDPATAGLGIFLPATAQPDIRNLFEDNQLQLTTPTPGPATASQSAPPLAAGAPPFSMVPVETAAATDMRLPASQQPPPPIREQLPHRTAPLLPAQVPVVANLMPPMNVPGSVIVEVPPPVEAVEPHPGLPASDIGERPMMSGDRYAAIVTTATRLLPAASAEAFGTNVASSLAQVAPAGMHATTTEANSAPASSPVPWPSQPLVSTPPAEANWAETIAVRMREGPQGEPVTLSFQLQPKELGTLHVQVQLHDQQIRAQLVVPNQEVRQFLESHLPDLRQRLEAMGLAVGSLDVAVDSGGQGHAAMDHPQGEMAVSPYYVMASVHHRMPEGSVEIDGTAGEGAESPNNPSPRLDVIA